MGAHTHAATDPTTVIPIHTEFAGWSFVLTVVAVLALIVAAGMIGGKIARRRR